MISIVIPCYDMAGRGLEMLSDLIASIDIQHVPPRPNSLTEVIVSDASSTDDIREYCSHWPDWWRWVKGKPGAAANLNNAIDHARGDIIKPMFQDDRFMEPDTLQKISDRFHAMWPGNGDDLSMAGGWVACRSWNDCDADFLSKHPYAQYEHRPYPHKSIERLREGENTYGGPSAMAWLKNDLRFDENLHWLFDCEFYARMAERYGVPAFIDTPIYIRQWEGQATRTVADGSQRVADLNYVVERYRGE